MKKILCSLLVGIILTSSLSVSAASFTDIKQGDWYYETVTEMTEKGLFNGKGNNLFCPDDTMTKAEFLAVTMRIICPDANLKAEEGHAWWQPAYNLAKQVEIIVEDIFPADSMENVITRQEMAYISSMAFFAQKDGNPDDEQYKEDVLVATQVSLSAHNSQEYGFDLKNTIPDYDEIENDYKACAVIAYGTGLLGGVDDTGRFAPKDTLTRAEGATVLHRLIRKDKRLKKSTPDDKQAETSETVVTPSEDLSAPITIYEGQERTNRLAKEGDTVVKADGTSVVLKKGPNGVLGEGQGVAPDLGFTWTYKDRTDVVRNNESFDGRALTGDRWVDSVGENITSNTYYVNPLTGEGHWKSEWSKITQAEKKVLMQNDIQGKSNGELSPQGYFIWHNGKWVNYIANQYLLTDYYPNLLK